MVDLSIHRPFVYRAAMPWLVGLGADSVGVNPVLAVRIAVSLCYLVAYVGFERLALMFRANISPKILPLIWGLPLFLIILPAHHAYDSVTLVVFTWAMIAIANQNTKAYVVLFVLAAINKETTITLILFFALACWGTPQFWKLILFQVVSYVLIRGCLVWVFQDSPGGIVERNWEAYLYAITKLSVLFFAIYGLMLFALIQIVQRWERLPQLAKFGLITIALPLAVLTIPFGFPFEFRVLLEAYPLLLLALFGRFSRQT